MYAVYT